MAAAPAAAQFLIALIAATIVIAAAVGQRQATKPQQPQEISDGLLLSSESSDDGRATDGGDGACGCTSDVCYFVVLDAGSTGTRAVVHAFRRVPGTPLGLEHTGYARFRRKPGLSAFRNFPGRSRRQLEALLTEAAAAVPIERRAGACALLRATAGFRLMDDRSRHLVAREARAALAASQFASPGLASVRMLAGSEEAKFTWLSVNYVLGNFRIPGVQHQQGQQQTRPVIEMGGGSLQIAYESPDGEESLTGLFIPAEDPLLRPRTPQRLRLRARSYLGLGIRESVLRFVGHDDRADDDGDEDNVGGGGGRASYRTPCLAENLTLDFIFGPVEVQLNGSSGVGGGGGGAAAGDHECLSRARHLIAELDVRPEPALNLPANRPVYAISGLYHLLQFLHQRRSQPAVRHSATVCPGRDRCQAYATCVGDLSAAASSVCRDLPTDPGPFKPYYCINLAVTAALLQSSSGMGLAEDTPLVALGDQEALGWTLGLSLDYLRAAAVKSASRQCQPILASWLPVLAAALYSRSSFVQL